jgi:hypothetical protein
MKEIPKGDHIVIGQNWEEVERGWGVRPDGFSLHVSLESLKKWVDHFREQRRAYPDEFTVQDGEPYPVEVDDATLREIAVRGFKFYGREYRYPEGNNGSWRQIMIDGVKLEEDDNE